MHKLEYASPGQRPSVERSEADGALIAARCSFIFPLVVAVGYLTDFGSLLILGILGTFISFFFALVGLIWNRGQTSSWLWQSSVVINGMIAWYFYNLLSQIGC